ncbi:MAG: hypothetical protein AAF907_04415 [Planctomycetota bacterium]
MTDDLAQLVQRCADGELSDADRAALHAQLDADPTAYKPLALALLERRLIDDALRSAIREEPRAKQPMPAPALAEPPTRRLRRYAGRFASAAAGLLIGLSWSLFAASTNAGTAADSRVAATPEPSLAETAAQMTLAASSADDESDSFADPSFPPTASAAERSPMPEPTPVALMEWRSQDGTPVSLPVYDEYQLTPSLAAQAADPLPAGWREELIRTGRFAGEVRQEYTVPLADGRLLTVPVHAVSVRGPEVF